MKKKRFSYFSILYERSVQSLWSGWKETVGDLKQKNIHFFKKKSWKKFFKQTNCGPVVVYAQDPLVLPRYGLDADASEKK